MAENVALAASLVDQGNIAEAWEKICTMTDPEAYDLRIRICIQMNQLSMATEEFERMQSAHPSETLTELAYVRNSLMNARSVSDFADAEGVIEEKITKLTRWNQRDQSDTLQHLISYQAASYIGQEKYADAVKLLNRGVLQPLSPADMSVDDLANVVVCLGFMNRPADLDAMVAALRHRAPAHPLVAKIEAADEFVDAVSE